MQQHNVGVVPTYRIWKNKHVPCMRLNKIVILTARGNVTIPSLEQMNSDKVKRMLLYKKLHTQLLRNSVVKLKLRRDSFAQHRQLDLNTINLSRTLKKKF